MKCVLVKSSILLVLLITLQSFSTNCTAQSKNEIIELTKQPRNTRDVPLFYKIARPRNETWDADYNFYRKFITLPMKRTQLGMSYVHDSVITWVVANSAIPHAQLDTATKITDPKAVTGTWRMVKHRSVRFTDSVRLNPKAFFSTDTLLWDRSSEEDAFAVFTENNLKMYSLKNGSSKMKTTLSTRYSMENERAIQLFRFFKSAGVIGQIGIDENGLLILNFPAVIENKRPGEYIAFITVIEQMIFEKMNR